MIITGTTSKNLINYIHRVADYLNLDTSLIELNVSKSLQNSAGGYCHGDADDVIVSVARNDQAGKIPKEQILINIAHEMVHAKQLLTEQMVNTGFVPCANSDFGLKYVVTWEGVEYSNVPYNDQPWEIDAYAQEQSVYEECK